MNRVLIVSALAGFIRSFLTQDIKILQSMGYEVWCAANKNHPGADGIDDYFKNLNVKFIQIDFSSTSPLSRSSFLAYIQLNRVIKNNEFKIVHCHTPIASVITRWICRKERKHGLKVIYTTHGFYFHKKSSKKSWMVYGKIEKFMSRFCDAIVTINTEDYSNAKNMYCKNVYYISGVGVDIDKFKKTIVDRDEYRKSIGVNKNDIMVLSVGELSKRKNQIVVVKALANIKSDNYILVHCGNVINNVGVKEELLKVATDNNVRVKLLGLRKDIPEICKCADVGTISSTREGLGLAGIEMIASGLPIVASNVHGILDYMIDEKNGFLADPYNEIDFANKIQKVVNNHFDKEYLYDSVKKFSKDNSYIQIKKIYNEIINDEER